MKLQRKLIALIALAIIMLTCLSLYDLYIHNFHTVIPQKIYRSRELSKAQFENIIAKYHIKSILNLRGTQTKIYWYDQEIAASQQFQVEHYDIPLHSKILPMPEELQQLVEIITTAPKPLLIHCESGVDRTGLAAVIALILNDAPMQQVEKQVSWKYFVFSRRSVGKQFLQLYQEWLAANHLQTNRDNFYQFIASMNKNSLKNL